MKRQSRIFALVQYVSLTNKYITCKDGQNHAFGGWNSECVVFGQAVFLASTDCYAGYSNNKLNKYGGK